MTHLKFLLCLCFCGSILAEDSVSYETVQDEITGETYIKPKQNKIVAKILDGIVTDKFDITFQAGIIDKTSDAKHPFCGGTLISEDYVLTAAHCFIENDAQVKLAKDIHVLLGENDLNNQEDGQECIGVEKIIAHPDFHLDSEFVYQNDLALLKLTKSATIRDSIKTICLQHDTNENLENVKMRISGWGILDRESTLSDRLRSGTVKGFSQTECNQIYKNIRASHLCIESDIQDFCQGDSGGPVFALLKDELVQVGILSFGQLCSEHNNKPGVVTRISNFIGWIKSNSNYEDC